MAHVSPITLDFVRPNARGKASDRARNGLDLSFGQRGLATLTIDALECVNDLVGR